MDKINFNSFDILPTPIWIASEAGKCSYVNDAWVKFTGQSLNQALGEGWLASVHSEDIAKFKCNEMQFEHEFRLKKKNAEYAWVVSKIAKHGNNFVGVVSDISVKIHQQQAAEDGIKQSKRFLRSVLESIPDPIFVKDEQHRWIDGNKAFFDMFSLPKEDVIGKSDYDFFGKEEADIFWKKDNEVFATETVVDNFETFTRDGFTRTFFTRKVVVADPKGRKILIGTIRDITELERVKKDLEKVVEDLTSSNEELERFAYIASHDLQEPLRMVINFTQLLKERYGDKLDDSAKLYIDFATDAAARMGDMVDDLLEYARLSHDFDREEIVDCNNLLKYVLDNLRELIKESEAEIICPKKLPILTNANPVRLSRVFQNIISNAIKYRKSDIAPQIEISYRKFKKSWQFSISDNGIGIDEAYFKRIFLPFKRLHAKEEYSGTGIGLAVCKKIINSFGGKISVKSKLGQGATFLFTIPRGEAS